MLLPIEILADMIVRFGLFITVGAVVMINLRLRKERGDTPHPIDPNYRRGWIWYRSEVMKIGGIIIGSAYVIGFLGFVQNTHGLRTVDEETLGEYVIVSGLVTLVIGYWMIVRTIWIKNPALATKINIAVVVICGLWSMMRARQAHQEFAQQQAQNSAQQQNEWLAQQIAYSQQQAVNQALAQHQRW